MVNGLMIVAGTVGAGALYILGSDLFGGKHKAIVFNNGRVNIVKASRSKDGKQYIFKDSGIKHMSTPSNNEYYIGKNKTLTLWEVDKHVAFPLSKKDKKLGVEDVNVQLQLLMALEQVENKINASWWDKNKEAVVGLTMIAAGVIIYILSLKFSSEMNPESANACLRIAADIKNSSLTTESNIKSLVGYINNNVIPK